jgi:RNA polymerase sigma-70 factor (ECF subfamily)
LDGRPPTPDAWTQRLLGAQAGDRSAFGTLVEDLKPWLLARLRCQDSTQALFSISEDVEDALQDGAMNALKHLDEFDPTRGSAKTWLEAITRNAALNILRRRRWRPTLTLFFPNGEPRPEIDPNAVDPAASAERNEQRVLAQNRVEQFLETLSQDERTAWVLRERQGLSYQEMAKQLGRSIGTIGTWLHRVRQAARTFAPS